MTSDLIKIIRQAEVNGFSLGEWCIQVNVPYTGMYQGIISQLIKRNLVDTLLLDIDFNKAFWGEKQKCKCSGICIQYNSGCCCEHKTSGWKYHLQTVVLEDNKIEYFKKGLT